jgi:hypothetical protein
MKRGFGVLGRWVLVVAACCSIAPVALAVGAGASRSSRLTGRQVNLGPAQGLIARLAVLRRAQTAADVLPSALHLPRFSRGGVIIPSLTRLVALTPNAKLFLVVMTPPGGPRPALWGARFGDQVAIVAVTAAGASESVGIPAADLSNADQLEAALGGTSVAASARTDEVGIVPDGVARVSWTFAALSNRGFHPGRVVSLPVSNNVAVVARDKSTAVLLSARWYAADGTRVPSSDRALRQATAARDATIRRQIIRQDARTRVRPSPAIVADFAVFTVHSRTGVRIPGGTVISKPSLTTVPLPILQITSGRQPPQLDPEEMRQVTTRSGFQFWVIPGQRGLCVAFVDSPRPPLFGGGAGEGCSVTVSATTSLGGGLSSGYPGGRSVSVRLLPNTHPTITVRSRDGHRRTIRPPYGIYVTHTGPPR